MSGLPITTILELAVAAVLIVAGIWLQVRGKREDSKHGSQGAVILIVIGAARELIDRSLALSEVVRTLFVRRPLQPGESYTGIVPFVRFDDPPQTLRIESWQRGEDEIDAEFCLNWRQKG